MKKMFETIRDILLPGLMVLSMAAVLEGIGYCLCPASMQGGEILTLANRIGWVLVRISGAVLNNSGLFLSCLAGASCCKEKLTGAAIGISAGLIGQSIQSTQALTVLSGRELSELTAAAVDLFPLADGLVCGMIASCIVQKWHSSGTSVVLGLLGSAVASAVLLGMRILLYQGLYRLGQVCLLTGMPGAVLYTILNRLLCPFQLHRPLNLAVLSNPVSGDLVRFWARETAGDPGRYMSGFFAPMIAGVPMTCYFLARRLPETKRFQRIVLLTAGAASLIAGLSEPFEYLLLFTSPIGYVCYALLYGLFELLSLVSGFRSGFACSGGLSDLIFSSLYPAASSTWLIMPLGILAGVLFPVVLGKFITSYNIDNRETEKII
ncbi:MAG: PTS transporter subunit EIIC [Solobacterium sp.]|nr:PTS transporter subunit EIIC [Solobacterium sp.]